MYQPLEGLCVRTPSNTSSQPRATIFTSIYLLCTQYEYIHNNVPMLTSWCSFLRSTPLEKLMLSGSLVSTFRVVDCNAIRCTWTNYSAQTTNNGAPCLPNTSNRISSAHGLGVCTHILKTRGTTKIPDGSSTNERYNRYICNSSSLLCL